MTLIEDRPVTDEDLSVFENLDVSDIELSARDALLYRTLTDLFDTARNPSPIHEIEGWGIGLENVDSEHAFYAPDIYDFQAEHHRRKIPAHLTIGYLVPIGEEWAQILAKFEKKKQGVVNLARTQASLTRQQTILVGIAAGKTVAQACEAAGVSVHTYNRYKRDFPEFSAEVAQLRSERKKIAGELETTETSISLPKASDFAAFRKHYFGFDTYRHHQMIVDALEKPNPNPGSPHVVLILLPPEAGKSTVMGDYICWKLANDPNHRILLVSEQVSTGGKAQQILADVKERMTDPDYQDPHAPENRVGEYIARFGPFHDKNEDKKRPWNSKYVKIDQAGGGQWYSVQVAGWRSKVYGNRCDALIFDDVQSTESLNLTGQILDTLRGTFFNRPTSGKIIFVGTRVGVGDIYEHLITEGVAHEVIVLPAVDEDGESYCPEMWPVEALLGTEDERAEKVEKGTGEWGGKRGLVAEKAWWCNYMQQPRNSTKITITTEMIEDCKNERLRVGSEPPVGWGVMVGLDPALVGGNAQVCAAYTAEKLVIVDCEVDYNLARNEEIYDRIRSYVSYRFTDLVIERNAAQRGIVRDQRLRDMGKQFGFQILEHETNRNKNDTTFGVGAMAGAFLRKEVVIPWADPTSRQRVQPLIDQLLSWFPGSDPRLVKQDLVMALWFVWLHWEQKRRTMNVDSSAWRTKGLPWTPGDMSGNWGRTNKVDPWKRFAERVA